MSIKARFTLRKLFWGIKYSLNSVSRLYTFGTIIMHVAKTEINILGKYFSFFFQKLISKVKRALYIFYRELLKFCFSWYQLLRSKTETFQPFSSDLSFSSFSLNNSFSMEETIGWLPYSVMKIGLTLKLISGLLPPLLFATLLSALWV